MRQPAHGRARCKQWRLTCMKEPPDTCPYIFKINQKVETKVPLQRKKVDDVLGGDEAWENVDQTDSKPQHYRMLACFHVQPGLCVL
ncbi:hypothetical protein AaE_013465 [Aphanomyces astaci]|uniref:Uncharacterized protein n=1 Tax=Aphanomyces astaci TaxID=112090 RepID=A0A6A4ZJH8_APHAT|nr:hypothetical protein AaE_013465 [Aphanomyces astaci]